MKYGIFPVMAGREAGGPETYEVSLIRALASVDKNNEYLIYCLSKAAADSFDLSQENVQLPVIKAPSRLISIPFMLPYRIAKDNIDLMHATFIPPPFSPKKYLFTMHSAVHFVHPEFYPLPIRLRLNSMIYRGAKQAEEILCVSENVKQLTAEHYRLPERKLSVVYHGVEKIFKPQDPEVTRIILKERWGINSPYLFAIGKLQANKNTIRVIKAFHALRNELDNGSDLKLVLAGRKTWTSDGIDETIKKLKLSEDVLSIGHIDHHDLPTLYSGAELLCFPSLWEGFGLPVLEAMACGTPVVTSNLASLPEITGGIAELVDPYKHQRIAEGMYRVITNSNLREGLVKHGLTRANQFTWERCAEQTLAAYQRYSYI
jgi:glycosyltransferase involved in cell wall biosynthesis